MDDMNAFESQIASLVRQTTRPPRPVDSASIVRALTSQPPKSRFQMIFSATKLVVAGAIVALFGGFLFTSVLLPQQSDESLPPAAASASASPESVRAIDLLPSVDLIIEEVEPGVLRVVNDGIRDLARPLFPCSYCGSWMTLTAGLDGSIWLSPGRLFKGDRELPTAPGHEVPFQLGHPVDPTIAEETRTTDGAPTSVRIAQAGPDGADWVFDGSSWSFVARPDVARPDNEAYSQVPDSSWGSMLAAGDYIWASRDSELGRWVGGQGWETWEIPLSAADRELVGVSDGGVVWVRGVESDRRSIGRFDGSDWQIYTAPLDPRLVAVGPEGTLWANSEDGERLLRFDGTEWTEYSETDGVPPMGLTEWPIDVEVASDGSVWVNSIRSEASQDNDPDDQGYACGGVHHFDGTTWTRYLQSTCVYDMDIAPDGTVWLRAGTYDLNADPQVETVAAGPVELYAIRPKPQLPSSIGAAGGQLLRSFTGQL